MLSQTIKKRLVADSGLNYDQYIRLSPFAEKKVFEGITRKKISISKKRDYRKVGRGNPLIARRRVKTIEEVDKGLSEIQWDWNQKK